MIDENTEEKVDELLSLFSKDNPTESIQQISYLIFLKQLENQDEVNARNARIKNKQYASIFKDNDDCKWSKWNNMDGDKLFKHVRDVVFPFLRKLDQATTHYAKYLQNANFAISEASKLKRAINIIDSDVFKDKDMLGPIYHYLLSQLNIENENKQYKTPDHIIELMVKLVEPDIKDTVCDPTCATGNFLVEVYKQICDKYTEDGIPLFKLGTEEKNKLKQETLFGFNPNQSMTRVAIMNLMNHGIKNPNITQINTLSLLYKESDKYNLVITNPPFNEKVSSDEISEDFTIESKKSITLYLELIIRLLRTSGRAAVIVPEGVLFGANKAEKTIKQSLLDDCRLDAVIRMHSKIFLPFGKSISANILIFTKGEPTKEVLFYDMQNDGLSVDDKRNPTPDKNDIPDIIEKFFSDTKPNDRKSKCFVVPIEEIKKPGNDLNLSFGAYQEIEYKELKYDNPKDIIGNISDNEDKIREILDDIMGLMK